MRIAIEGMDGVGKTTIAKKIAHELNFSYISRPLIPLLSLNGVPSEKALNSTTRKIMDLDDSVIKAWFFGLGNIYSVRNSASENVVFDRHLVSNYFWNGNDETKTIFDLILGIIGKPDITILLEASVDKRLARLRKRNPLDRDIYDKEMHVLGYDKMIEFLKNYHMPYALIDTENMSISKVLEQCIKIIKKVIEESAR